MIKGCQREMVVLQTKGSPLFESAYFVLRRGRAGAAPARDMLAEANRLLQSGGEYLARRRGRRGLLLFLLGCGCGAALAALAFVVFWH